MSYAHLIFGILLFVTFTITGRFMRADFPDKDEMDQGFRLLMRSRHIYILFSSLIHALLGTYFRANSPLPSRILQYAGSAMLFVSSGLLVWAFVAETYQFHAFSNISRYGIYTSLAGVGLHMLGRPRPRES